MGVLLLLPVLAGMAALVVTGIVRRSPPSREDAVAAARAHARLGSGAAVVLGGAAGLWVGTARLEDATGAGDPGSPRSWCRSPSGSCTPPSWVSPS